MLLLSIKSYHIFLFYYKLFIVIPNYSKYFFKSCDYIIDLGPEGGDNGGTIVATGTPKEVSSSKHLVLLVTILIVLEYQTLKNLLFSL